MAEAPRVNHERAAAAVIDQSLPPHLAECNRDVLPAHRRPAREFIMGERQYYPSVHRIMTSTLTPVHRLREMEQKSAQPLLRVAVSEDLNQTLRLAQPDAEGEN